MMRRFCPGYNPLRNAQAEAIVKAVRFHEHGGPEVLRYEDLPDPQPGDGEALVRLSAIGVNFVDTYRRAGAYSVELPHLLGSEGAGEVVALGPGVDGVAVGDHVMVSGGRGAYAELVVAPASRLVKLPDGFDEATAAALPIQGMTAHFLVTSTYPLKEGETCLVHAGAGGVGFLLIQLAKMRGARVITTVSTEEKADLAREAGADEVVLYTQEDFVAEVKRITGGEGLPVVYDSVGKTTFDGSLDCLRPRGTLVLFGQSSGAVPTLDPQVLNAKGSLFLTRPNLAHYTATREEFEWRARDLIVWTSAGKLNVRIGERLPLAEAAEAHRRLEGRQTTGKVLLLP